MKPVPPKTDEMERALEDLGQAVFGHSRQQSLLFGICVSCGAPAKSFKDEIAEREYHISGLCQVCQDSFFCEDDEP